VLHIFYQFSCSSLNPSINSISFLKCGFHTEQQYSKCGLTRLLYKGINVDCDLSVKFLFIHFIQFSSQKSLQKPFNFVMLLLLMFITSAMLLLYLGNSERKIFSQFPTCNYKFLLYCNKNSNWEIRNYKFPSPMERSITSLELSWYLTFR